MTKSFEEVYIPFFERDEHKKSKEYKKLSKNYQFHFNKLKKKNLVAKNLFTKKYKPRVIKPKKGKGSFSRKTNKIKA